MTTATSTILNAQLMACGHNTIEEFCRRVVEVTRRRAVHSDLPEQLTRWQQEEQDYSAAFLTQQIRPSLVSLRDTLAQKQYRCDGDIDTLERTRRAITSGQAQQHLLDTIYAHTFVKWCDLFPRLTREVPATN